MLKQSLGFSFIEVIITLFIILVLSTIALQSYSHTIVKTGRSEGIIALLELAHRLDRHFAEHQSYQGASLSLLSLAKTTSNDRYTLEISNTTTTSFTIAAVPTTAIDPECATFIYNEVGKKLITGTGVADQCWQ